MAGKRPKVVIGLCAIDTPSANREADSNRQIYVIDGPPVSVRALAKLILRMRRCPLFDGRFRIDLNRARFEMAFDRIPKGGEVCAIPTNYLPTPRCAPFLCGIFAHLKSSVGRPRVFHSSSNQTRREPCSYVSISVCAIAKQPYRFPPQIRRGGCALPAGLAPRSRLKFCDPVGADLMHDASEFLDAFAEPRQFLFADLVMF